MGDSGCGRWDNGLHQLLASRRATLADITFDLHWRTLCRTAGLVRIVSVSRNSISRRTN
jgi:hypothetical protein